MDGVKKLVSNFRNKSKYVLHYRNLQLYLSLGKDLVKTYEILEFNQSDWLKNTLIFTQIRGRKHLIVLEKISSS